MEELHHPRKNKLLSTPCTEDKYMYSMLIIFVCTDTKKLIPIQKYLIKMLTIVSPNYAHKIKC